MKAGRKTAAGPGSRVESALRKDAGSNPNIIKERRNIQIWPEWNDAEVNSEKWDSMHKVDKKVEKGKSPVVQQHLFDDPEAKVEFAAINFKATIWKRPQDFVIDKVPVVVDPEQCVGFDLLSNSETALENELVRHIVSETMALFLNRKTKGQLSAEENVPYDGTYTYNWRPWEHIYALTKTAGKGVNMPIFNPFGKYIVKLYWMGAWRKLLIDDSIPFDEHDKCLLPQTATGYELWPLLLSKALIKIAAIDYGTNSSNFEFGDFNVIECLTGWVAENIPLKYGHSNQVWELLRQILPNFKLPDLEKEKEPGLVTTVDSEEPPTKSDETLIKESKINDLSKGKDEKPKKEKSDKKDKKDGKDKINNHQHLKRDSKRTSMQSARTGSEEKSILIDENATPMQPEYMVMASYCNPPKYPVRVSALAEMADASECLRQNRFSHTFTHSVLIQQTRNCPLEPPPVPEVIPNWKLIRPKKKNNLAADIDILDEETVKEKPIQSLEMFSSFYDYKVCQTPISANIGKRPKSGMERRSTRNTPVVEPIDEEGKPKPPTPPPPPPPREPTPPPVVEPSNKNGSGESDRKKSMKTVPSSIPSPDKGKKSKLMSSKSDIIGNPVASKDDSRDTSVHLNNASDIAQPVTQQPEKIDFAKKNTLWMDYEIFTKCFKVLTVYHKTDTYMHSARDSDLSKVTAPPPGNVKEKKGAAVLHAPEEKQPSFIFVDSLKPTEIVVTFNSLCRWPPERSTSLPKMKTETESLSESPTHMNNVTSSSTLTETIQQGLIVAEPYSWKTLIVGQSILRLRTTGTKTAVLTLQPGRHVMQLHAQSPLGYHLQLLSATPFVYGDEDRIMTELVKESCRFLEAARNLVKSLGKALNSFTDLKAFNEAWTEFTDCHCPYKNDKRANLKRHYEIWNRALFAVFSKYLKEDVNNYRTQEMVFAFRSLTGDCTSKNIFGTDLVHVSRPDTSNAPAITPRPVVVTPTATAAPSIRGSAREPKSKKRGGDKNKEAEQHAERVSSELLQSETTKDSRIEYWVNRYNKDEITTEEQLAAVRIQKVFRGHFIRNIFKARKPNGVLFKNKDKSTNEYVFTDLNTRCSEWLQKAWSTIENKQEEFGLQIFRNVFQQDETMLERYPFHVDEWNKIAYHDYSGSYPEKGPHSWFVLFKEVFYLSEETPRLLCLPKLYVPFQAAMVRVVDNDTGYELPKVFNQITPYLYKRNQKGYTIMAEGRTFDNPLPSGKWRLRLIGSAAPLPTPHKSESISMPLEVYEVRDYYLPKLNGNGLFLRYGVKNVSDDQVGIIQLSTSNSDVQFKLTVYDNDTEVVSTQGKGHAVLPAVWFYRTKQADDESSSKRGSAKNVNRGDNKGGKGGDQTAAGGGNKKTKQRSHSPGGGSSASASALPSSTTPTANTNGLISTEKDESGSNVVHKYIIEAAVLHDSWPQSERNWNFIAQLREQEKNELKVFLPHDQQPNTVVAETQPEVLNRPPSAGKTKGGKKTSSKAAAAAAAKDKLSRPPSQQFDISRPFWTLRVISESSDTLQVRKDTERAEQIRAMKRAWEEAEPGRAAKALESRLKYLANNMISVENNNNNINMNKEKDDEQQRQQNDSVTPVVAPQQETDDKLPDDIVLLNEPPEPPKPSQILKDLDIKQFLRGGDKPPVLLDEVEENRRMEERKEKMKEFREYREAVEKRRKEDKINRNKEKIAQIELYTRLQIELNKLREQVDEPREAYRQRLLEAERLRLEEIAAKEAALLAELEKENAGKKTPKGKKGKNSGKKGKK